tara:strand:+ start:700 stop:1179 length:480 start_codon:yes stop_codon:yes gene_type:complete
MGFKMKRPQFFSELGYKKNSPDVNKPVNTIKSGDITMKGVDFKVRGEDNLGNVKVMKPGKDYKFPGSVVTETPYKQTNKRTKGKGRHFRTKKEGAGMTDAGVKSYKSQNPGSKLQTAVTTKPSKLKPGSKAAKRRKSFCARSKGWTGERGKAARARWNC